MNLQLALDRMSIPEAVAMAERVSPYIDWIEAGTSLIKEFGMAGIHALKTAFPEKVIVADMKTFDNAKYEFELCYQAGADVATVMGAAPPVTVGTCMETAERFGKEVMIDLLHTTEAQRTALLQHRKAIFCLHVGKDEQEYSGGRLQTPGFAGFEGERRIAAAGGITLETLPGLLGIGPSVLIVGSAITGAADPERAARELRRAVDQVKEVKRS
ncbi:orotidine 5'-phosphate decarboxylase [Paenibacillus filicis]|uniref:3-hexulose-6-phosphate synthase n=1 Tax=Paenibacillus gyeongsangnamensis TaxID=3388067 RepID=A0ABT4QC60_9BACL|nr:3-hexulose-6-phosphate synthase [Paenibacillus filicis]MCZ8514482.1 orotidine 5'-phosphate decarboxylase [Paenibacillus filicis]